MNSWTAKIVGLTLVVQSLRKPTLAAELCCRVRGAHFMKFNCQSNTVFRIHRKKRKKKKKKEKISCRVDKRVKVCATALELTQQNLRKESFHLTLLFKL